MSIILSKCKKTLGEFNLDIQLKVKEGELLTFLGPSGCGKTTALRIIAGLIQPDSGEVYLNNKDITKIAVYDRNISMVFQNYALFPNMNVEKNIAYGPKNKKWAKEKINKRIKQLLKMVELSGFENRKIQKLSGGEKQRVALARAIAPEPEVLLLDEPLSALDAKLRTSLRSKIRTIQKELKLTTLYVTHDQEEALAVSDRIAVFNNGKIMQIGTAKELYNSPENIFTASFMGISNLFEYKYIACDVNLHTIEIFGKKLVIKQSNYSHSEGSVLFFRPEQCIQVKEKGINTFDAQISSLEYSGSNYLIELKINNQIIRTIIPQSKNYKVGDRYEFELQIESCKLINKS